MSHRQGRTLDERHQYGYIADIARSIRTPPARGLSGGGARAVPADGAIHPVPGRLGHQSPGITTGAGGASLDWDRRRRVTPAGAFLPAHDHFGKPVSTFPDHASDHVPGNLA